MNLLKTVLLTLTFCSLSAGSFFAVFTGAFAAPAAKEGPPVIVAAAGTSSSEDSAPVTCLLDPGCRGYWSPEAQDAGSNEGLYIRFKEPTHFNFMAIETEGACWPSAVDWQIYLDGRSTRFLANVPVSDPELGDSQVKYLSFSEQALPDNRCLYVAGARLTAEDDEGLMPLDYQGQSVFIKLAPSWKETKEESAGKILSIRFFDGAEAPEFASDQPQAAPMELELPLMAAAKAEASSTLEPLFAYDVAKLFDSQPDMAWSTNGKKSGGRGESISINFESEQEIHGLMLWNGYQRSDSHYKANGRVKTLKLAGQTLKVKDVQGSQIVRLPKAIRTAALKLEISEIYPGASYKDVLISELRFLGAGDRILLPEVKAPVPEAPLVMQELLDRTFVPFLHEAGKYTAGPDDCGTYYLSFDSTFRLRSNGSFVIYDNGTRGGDRSRAELSAVVEGNWEAQGEDGLRLFGKKYQTPIWVDNANYLPDDPALKKIPGPRIFQSLMKVARFSALEPDEQQSAVRYMLQSKWVEADDDNGDHEKEPVEGDAAAILLRHKGECAFVGGPDRETAVQNIVARLLELDPLYVKSDVYTEILVPRHVIYED